MKLVHGLTLLAALSVLTACNEQVSPELQNAGNTGNAPTDDTLPPDTFYFGIKNKSAPVLNYKLHKTGLNNSAVDCAVKNTVALSSDNYRSDRVNNDITCYFDAEELSLFHAGLSFNIESSKNTCDFIGYSAYGFFDRIPGDSTGTFTQVTCGNDTTSNANVVAAAATAGININTASGQLGCGDWATEDIVPGTRRKFQPSSDAELCRFNYKDGARERCDIGTITVNNFRVVYTPPNGTAPAITSYEVIKREIDCVGAIANCVQGPTKLQNPSTTRFTEISQTTQGKDFERLISYPGLIGKKNSNKSYVNFRRNLASAQIDFGASAGLLGAYTSSWSDSLYGKVFDPRVMDFFSRNLLLDGTTPVLDEPRILAEAVKTNFYSAIPLAADPYMGLEPSATVNPFYTFYCLDTALDIKARIRMVVREWDRVFPTNADNEYVSDLFRGTSARQDVPNLVEIPDDNDGLILFNDLSDWDDFIDMERTAGAFDPSLSIWRPNPTVDFVDGWFNDEMFTNNAY